MDGRVDSLMKSISLSMTVNQNYRVDCLLSEENFDRLMAHLVEIFGEDDSLPSIVLMNKRQFVLDNGSEFNRKSGGRSIQGSRPHIVIMDEGNEDSYAYMTGAAVVHLESEDLRFA